FGFEAPPVDYKVPMRLVVRATSRCRGRRPRCKTVSRAFYYKEEIIAGPSGVAAQRGKEAIINWCGTYQPGATQATATHVPLNYTLGLSCNPDPDSVVGQLFDPPTGANPALELHGREGDTCPYEVFFRALASGTPYKVKAVVTINGEDSSKE